jgi:hypothetical protein
VSIGKDILLRVYANPNKNVIDLHLDADNYVQFTAEQAEQVVSLLQQGIDLLKSKGAQH